MSDNEFEATRRSVLKHGITATGALVTGTALTGTAAAGIGEGRVGHYPLNSIQSGGTVHDASPYENDGQNNGATVVEGGGKVGNAFRFDGTSSEVAVSSTPSLNPPDAVTVAAWVKATGNTKNDYDNKGVAGKWNTTAGAGQYVLWTNVGGKLKYTFSVKTVNGRADASASISDNQWHHVAGVFDGTASIYVDGQLTTGTQASGDIKSSSVPFKIGNYATGKNFEGLIDEARVYDRALSQSEIQSLAAMGGNSGGRGRRNGRGNGNGRGP